MNALDFIASILDTTISTADLRYCLVTETKRPIKVDGTPAKPNCEEDFVELETLLQCENLGSYAGIGVSVQASKICAIDVDHCFDEAFNIDTADERAKDILSRFSKFAYCEFSFSGTGLRVLFRHDIIEHYSDNYYIKNESKRVEFYQPTRSYRYVTVTGRSIYNNDITIVPTYVIEEFLDDYMKKPERKTYAVETSEVETRTFTQLSAIVKRLYFKDIRLQDLWFGQAPGSGKNESELDYQLIAYLFEHVTQDKLLLKQLFESSPYFKSKDQKHVFKWNNQDGRYYEYIYSVIRRTHE